MLTKVVNNWKTVFQRPLSVAAGVQHEGYRREPKRALLTLHPSEMISKGQRTFDISKATRLRFSFRGENNPVSVCLQRINGRPLFPSNTQGVLYYHTDPALPPIAGEVRFRLCDRVEDFEHGSDLHILGIPWSLSLMHIACTPNFVGLRALLVKEGLVDNQMMFDISNLPNIINLDDRLTLFYLSQPFRLDLGVIELALNLVTRTTIHKVKFPNLFTDRRLGHSLPIYDGIMKARFELKHEASGASLVLRFLDYVTGVVPLVAGYDGGLLHPEPGQLLRRRPRLHLQPKVWSYPLTDKRKYGAVLKDFYRSEMKRTYLINDET